MMFNLGLFGVDENVFGGNHGKVGTGLFNLGCLCWDCLVLMKMYLVELLDVYGELNDYFLLRCSTHPGEVVAVTGSSSILGSWEKDKVKICSSVHISKNIMKNIIKVIQMVRQSQEDNLWRLNLGWVSAEELATAPRCQFFETNVESLNI